MSKRKKRLRIIQVTFILVGLILIFFTYLNNDNNLNKNIISIEEQEKIQEQLNKNDQKKDVFYNIKYSGIDLNSNRYVLIAKEASNDETNKLLVNLKSVEAFFYFKDDTILNIKSDEGIYNNKSLDMKFSNNVVANYQESQLFAQKAFYSNTDGFLTISEDVKVIDARGTIVADKLLFDIKKKTLDIESFNDNKINANIISK